jgi:predicted RNA binding protein YcfA (HicA-like mRNA interferase family)
LPRLKRLSGGEIREILLAAGFSEARQRGSHVVMQRREAGTTITVPVPMHRDVKTGTLMAIIRQSRLPRGIFED